MPKMTRIPGLLTAFMAAAWLSACATADPQITMARVDSDTGSAVFKPEPREHRAAVVALAPVVVPAAPAKPAVPPRRAKAVPRVNPSQLAGITDRRLVGLLGAPTLLRRDAPAEIWQYAGTNCVMLVFLYQDTGGGLAVRYVEWLSRAARVGSRLDAPAQQACLSEIAPADAMASAGAES